MKTVALLLASAVLAIPAAAQQAPRFTLEQRMQLRCSAVFAIVAGEQERGVARALAYPALGERGREYFSRTGAKLMDELKLSREQSAASLRAEVQAQQKALQDAADPDAYLASLMQPCLAALEASGL